MKFSMMTYTMARGDWGKAHDAVALCRFTRELGLDGVDWVTTYGLDPAEIKKIMEDYSLKTVCYTFAADLNFPDRKGREPGLEAVRQGIEAAVTLGTDKIMLPISGKEGLTRAASRRNVIAGLKEAVELGRRAGVTVTVEHFPNRLSPFIVSADVNEAVREIPDLRVTFDSGNVLTGGEDPAAGFENSCESIVHAHFKDWVLVEQPEGFPGADGRRYAAALIGEGMLDHRAILRAMKRANYPGYINLEYEGNKYTPEEAIRRALSFLNETLGEA